MIKIPLKYYKYCRLAINFFTWISLSDFKERLPKRKRIDQAPQSIAKACGAMNEILGPTMPDLSIRVSEDYSVVGTSLTIRIGASMATPFIVGILFDRFPRTRENGFGLIVILAGLFEVGIPYCRQIWTLILAMSLQGFCSGGMTTAGQSMIIELFGVGAVSALQFMHLGWGVGSVLASMIVRPFLAPNLKLSKNQINYPCLVNVTTNTSLDSNASAINTSNEGSRIEYAYIIISGYAIFIGTVALLFSFLPKPRRPNDTDSNANSKKSLKEMLGPGTISDGKPIFGTFMLVSIVLIYALDVGSYGSLGTYLVTIAIDPCKPFTMTQSNATLLQGMRAVCFSCSRVLFGFMMIILIAKKIQPGIVMGIYSVGMATSIALLSIIGYQYEIAFWIFNCTYAFFHAPFYGGCTPWFNQYIRVTSSVIAVAVIGSGVGKFVVTWLGGYILSTTYSQVFLLLIMALIMTVMAIVACVLSISLKVGKRPTFAKTNEKNAKLEEKPSPEEFQFTKTGVLPNTSVNTKM